MVDFSNPSSVSAPIGMYSHSATVKAGTDLIFISGQVGRTVDGTVPHTIEEQADLAFGNIVAILKSHGLGPQNLVKMQVFITDRAYREGSNAARRKHLGEARPTSTFLIVQGLAQPEYFIEVEAIAAR